MYFVQFSMSQKRRKGAKFMPENEVFGQAGGGGRLWLGLVSVWAEVVTVHCASFGM